VRQAKQLIMEERARGKEVQVKCDHLLVQRPRDGRLGSYVLLAYH